MIAGTSACGNSRVPQEPQGEREHDGPPPQRVCGTSGWSSVARLPSQSHTKIRTSIRLECGAASAFEWGGHVLGHDDKCAMQYIKMTDAVKRRVSHFRHSFRFAENANGGSVNLHGAAAHDNTFADQRSELGEPYIGGYIASGHRMTMADPWRSPLDSSFSGPPIRPNLWCPDNVWARAGEGSRPAPVQPGDLRASRSDVERRVRGSAWSSRLSAR